MINLVYGMLAFDALTAEKIAFEKGPSLPKKSGRDGKRPRSLVTAGTGDGRADDHFFLTSLIFLQRLIYRLAAAYFINSLQTAA